jgi:hypothetical protein
MGAMGAMGAMGGAAKLAWAGCAAMATPFGTALRATTEFPALGDPATRVCHA